MHDRHGNRWPVLRWIALSVLRVITFLLLLDACLFALFDLLPDAAIIQTGALGLDPQTLAEARVRMGLSGPWYQRFAQHWWHLLEGDFGRSLVGGYDIAPVLAARMLRSAPLWAGAIAVLLLVPIPMASLYARRGPLTTRLTLGRFTAGLLIAPQFISVAAAYAIWTWGLADTRFAGDTRWLFAMVGCVSLPLGVAFVAAANTFHDVAQQRFCETYLAIGLSWRATRLRLTKNVLVAMRPLLARLVLGVLLGTVFAELMFEIKGFGYLFVEALKTSDLNVMRGWMLVTGFIVLLLTEAERRA